MTCRSALSSLRITYCVYLVVQHLTLYSLCLTNTMSGVEGWRRVNAIGDSKGELEHYGASHEVIDKIIDNVKMNYEYVTDSGQKFKIQIYPGGVRSFGAYEVSVWR